MDFKIFMFIVLIISGFIYHDYKINNCESSFMFMPNNFDDNVLIQKCGNTKIIKENLILPNSVYKHILDKW